jgi:hypothetical protein
VKTYVGMVTNKLLLQRSIQSAIEM